MIGPRTNVQKSTRYGPTNSSAVPSPALMTAGSPFLARPPPRRDCCGGAAADTGVMVAIGQAWYFDRLSASRASAFLAASSRAALVSFLPRMTWLTAFS